MKSTSMKQFALLLVSSVLASRPNDESSSSSRLCPTMNTPMRNCTADQYTITFAPPLFANDACIHLGLNLASVSLVNGEVASRALRRCFVPWAIVNQQQADADGVTVLTNDGVLVPNAERDYCGRNVRVAILCEQVTPPSSSSINVSSTTIEATTSLTNSEICQPTCGSGNFTLGLMGSYQNATCPLGYELAMVNITNIQQASSILANCTLNISNDSSNSSGGDAVGSRAAWVRGWNQDEYQNQTCLVLTLGSASSGIGTIVPALNCTAQYRPLCQKKQQNQTMSCDYGGWKLLKQKVGYAVAKDACRCFSGYDLAIVEQPSVLIAQLYEQCFNSTNSGEDVLWIRNGKGIGKCAAMVMLPGVSGRFYPSFGLTDKACKVIGYPLCKRKMAIVPCPRSSSEPAKLSTPCITSTLTCTIASSSSESTTTPCISSGSEPMVSETEKISTLPQETSTSCESIEYMSRSGPQVTTNSDDSEDDVYDDSYDDDNN